MKKTTNRANANWSIVHRKTGEHYSPTLTTGDLNARLMISRSGLPIVVYNRHTETTLEFIDMTIWEVTD